MRRFVPRAVLGAALVVSAAACAAGTATSGGSAGGGAGSRYQVMVPAPEIQGGVAERDAERVANQLRNLVRDMERHTSVDPGVVNNAMRQFGVEQLTPITARQLAQQIGAQNVLYLQLSPGGAGLSADVQIMDVPSNDVIELEDVTAANANELAAAIFAGVQQTFQGISQASFCNDYLSSSQYDRALTNCEEALAVVPTSTTALYGKATALLYLERHEEALEAYNELLERDDTHQEALLGAGLAASTLSQTDEALDYYNRYLQLNPGNVQVRMTVASRIANTGDYVSAFRVLEPAIEAEEYRDDPVFQRFLFGLATAAGQRIDTEQGENEARPFFETALRAYELAFASDSLTPDVAQIRQAIAVNVGLGNMEEALTMAREATVQYDTVSSIWSQYASALVEAERHAEAAQAFTRVIELDPNAENAHLRRGMAYLAAGQRQQGLADLQQAADRGNASQVAVVMFQEAGRALQNERWSEAETLLATATRHAAADVRPQVVFFHGVSLYRQGETIAKANTQGDVGRARQALEYFRRALPLIQQGSNAQKAQMIDVIQQYIANHEAIIQAGSR
jgi:tetratricopeptide (TPR) repeat protein